LNDTNSAPPPSGDSDLSNEPSTSKTIAALALLYVAAVLVIDTLAVRGVDVPIRWSMFHSNFEVTAFESLFGITLAPEWSQFDMFKFTAWFLVPVAFSLYRFDIGNFGVRRWKRSDLAILGVLMIFGIGAVSLIPFFPSLDRIYSGLGDRSAELRWAYAVGNLLWMISWLIGWEFMLRYFLMRKVVSGFGKHAWLIIPALEFAYHLQKPFLEALLAGGGGVLLTYWALQRKNVLLPFLAHLSIEVALLVFILVT
jgi:hypothetical protein